MTRKLVLLVSAALLLLTVSGCRYAILEKTLINDTYKLNDVCAVDADNVWAVGSQGKILFYDGTRWVNEESDTGNTLFGVDASSSHDVWAVGRNGTVVHFDGSRWQQQKKITTSDLFDVSVIDSGHVYAVGAKGTVLSLDGSAWKLQSLGTSYLLGVAAASQRCIWAVGVDGVWFCDGEWKKQYDPGFPVHSVSATDEGHAYAVGYGSGSNPVVVSTILSFTGNWSQVKQVPDCALDAVCMTGASNVWAAGSTGTTVHLDNKGWTSTTNQYENYAGISGAGGNDIWVVGSEIGAKWVSVPLIKRYDGSWKKEDIPLFEKPR